MHHDRRVPAERVTDPLLELLVAGVRRLLVGGDRVDVVGADQRGNPDMALTRPFQQLQHDVAGAVAPTMVDHPIE